MPMKTIEHKAEKGQKLTLDEVDHFIQDARRSGASGQEVLVVTATFGGKLQKVAVEIEVPAVAVTADRA